MFFLTIEIRTRLDHVKKNSVSTYTLCSAVALPRFPSTSHSEKMGGGAESPIMGKDENVGCSFLLPIFHFLLLCLLRFKSCHVLDQMMVRN